MSRYNKLRPVETLWFHEALCDVAAISTLEQMAASPMRLSSGADVSTAIGAFSRRFTGPRQFQLPNGVALYEWLRFNEDDLRAIPNQPTKIGVIAVNLLPFVKRAAEYWGAIQFLPSSESRIDEYLEKWKRKCPELQRPFVEEIAKGFRLARGSASGPGTRTA
jgi:hypothetical protein